MADSLCSSAQPIVRTYLFHLYAARGVRGFGDGFAVIILPAYLTTLGYTPFQIGLVATAALLGSALLTLAVGFFAPRHDLRTLLIAGARSLILRPDKSPWLQALLARRPVNVAVVALAHKLARQAWALLAHQRDYDPHWQPQPPAAQAV